MVVSCRLGRTANPLNRKCRPAVKVENAIRAKIPVLVADDPAIVSLYGQRLQPVPLSHFRNGTILSLDVRSSQWEYPPYSAQLFGEWVEQMRDVIDVR